jgi:hypothetical protein
MIRKLEVFHVLKQCQNIWGSGGKVPCSLNLSSKWRCMVIFMLIILSVLNFIFRLRELGRLEKLKVHCFMYISLKFMVIYALFVLFQVNSIAQEDSDLIPIGKTASEVF